MKLFESDNIWKKNEREKRRAARPDTPRTQYEDARTKLISDAIWLCAALILAFAGIILLLNGIIAAEPVSSVFIIVLILYVCINIPSVKKEYESYKKAKDKIES